MTAGRGRTVAYGALLAGTVGAFAAGAQPWWRAEATGTSAPVTGTVASGSLSQALAVVTVAGLLLSLTLAAWGRQVLGGVLVLAGAGMVAVGAARPRPAADVVAEALRSVTLSVEWTLTGTAWPWVYAAAGLLVALGGGLLTVLSPRWETRRSRFERGTVAVDLTDATAVWKAMDAGVDPTTASAIPSAEQDTPPGSVTGQGESRMSHSAIGHAPEEKYHHGKSPASYAFSIIFMVAVVVGVVGMVPAPHPTLLIIAGVIALAAWITWAVLRGMGRDNV